MDTACRTDSRNPPPHPQSPSRDYSPVPPPRNVEIGKKKALGKRTIANCGGDTRWSPPAGEWAKPIYFVYAGDRRRRIFYHFIYGNTALEVQDWMREFGERAAVAASKIESPLITIMNALNSKKLRPISEGQRRKVWILDEGYEEVWESMRIMNEEKDAMRILSGWERFNVLGICLEEYKGDVLLVSQVVPIDQVTPARE